MALVENSGSSLVGEINREAREKEARRLFDCGHITGDQYRMWTSVYTQGVTYDTLAYREGLERHSVELAVAIVQGKVNQNLGL